MVACRSLTEAEPCCATHTPAPPPHSAMARITCVDSVDITDSSVDIISRYLGADLALLLAHGDHVLHLLGGGVEDLDGVGGPAPDVTSDHHHLPHLHRRILHI